MLPQFKFDSCAIPDNLTYFRGCWRALALALLKEHTISWAKLTPLFRHLPPCFSSYPRLATSIGPCSSSPPLSLSLLLSTPADINRKLCEFTGCKVQPSYGPFGTCSNLRCPSFPPISPHAVDGLAYCWVRVDCRGVCIYIEVHIFMLCPVICWVCWMWLDSMSMRRF